MEAFHLRAHSLPFWALAASLVVLGTAGAVLRGDRMRRLGVMVLAVCALPWAVSIALAGCTDDRVLALSLCRAGIGPVSIAGPAILFLVLSDAGKLDAHRLLVAVAAGIAVVSMVVTWSTPLVISSARTVVDDMYYPGAGPLNSVHVGSIAVWAGIGIAIARRGQRQSRDHSRRLVNKISLAIAALSMIATMDTLVAEGVIDIFPISWLPAMIAVLLASYGLWRTNRMRGDGFDRHGAVELVVTLVAGGAVVAVVLATSGSSAARPLAIAALTAPLPALAFLIGMPGRDHARHAHASAGSGDAMIGFAERLQHAATADAITAELVAFICKGASAASVRVWRLGPDGLTPLTRATEPLAFDARIRAWLLANRAPIVVGDVPSMRLGGMRALVEAMVNAVDADVIVPLIDRDTMVGLVAVMMPEGRSPRPADRELMADAVAATAQALTFTGLRHEAEARAQTAREVEVADAIQQARADGDVRIDVGRWRVMACYRPGGKVAGDVWTWADLGNGELLLVVGDVIGRGLSAALIAAAVAGAVESTAALRGGALEPGELLELLHETVVGVSGPTQTLGALALVLGHGRVRWAAAGHRGAYRIRPAVVHPEATAPPEAQVTALASSGTPLGERKLHLGHGEAELAADDLIVVASDGLIDVTDARGVRWGERRLVRAMRTWVTQAGDGAAEQLVSAAASHAGDTPLDDDMVVVAAHLRGAS